MSETVAQPVTQPTATAIDAVAQTTAPRAAKAEAAAAAQAGTEIGEGGRVVAKPPPADEFFDVPVNGKTKRVTKAELLKRYSLEEAAEQRFNEAAKLRREAEEREAVWNDPEKALELLKKRHPDRFRDTVERVYKEDYIDPEEMDPRDLKIRQYEKQLAEIESQKEREAEAKKAKEDADEDERTAGELQREIMGIVETSGLPKTKFTAARIAHWMRINEVKNLGLPAELIVKKVKDERRDIMRSEMQAMSVEQMIETYGDDAIKKLRAWDIEQIRKRRGAPPVEVPTEKKESLSQQFEKIRPSEVRRRAREFR